MYTARMCTFARASNVICNTFAVCKCVGNVYCIGRYYYRANARAVVNAP